MAFRTSRQLAGNLATFSTGRVPTAGGSQLLVLQRSANPQPIRTTPTVLWNETRGPRNPFSVGGAIFVDPIASKG